MSFSSLVPSLSFFSNSADRTKDSAKVFMFLPLSSNPMLLLKPSGSGQRRRIRVYKRWTASCRFTKILLKINSVFIPCKIFNQISIFSCLYFLDKKIDFQKTVFYGFQTYIRIDNFAHCNHISVFYWSMLKFGQRHKEPKLRKTERFEIAFLCKMKLKEQWLKNWWNND